MSCVYVGRANFILAIRHNQPLRRVLLPLDCVDVPFWYAPRPPGERSMILGGLWRWRRPGHCSAGTCGLALHRDGTPDQRTHAAPGEAPASRIQLRGTKHLRGSCRLGSLRHRCCLPAQTVLRSGGPLSMDWYPDWRPVYHLFADKRQEIIPDEGDAASTPSGGLSLVQSERAGNAHQSGGQCDG